MMLCARLDLPLEVERYAGYRPGRHCCLGQMAHRGRMVARDRPWQLLERAPVEGSGKGRARKEIEELSTLSGIAEVEFKEQVGCGGCLSLFGGSNDGLLMVMGKAK